MTEVEKLAENLKNMDFPEDCEGRNIDENYDCANLEELSQRSLAEVIEASNKKVRQKAQEKEKERDDFYDDDSDASYPMTDY